MKPAFLTLDEVLALHADQIDRYGGRLGVRAVELLESALAVPATTFGGRHLHGDLHEMAAAYLFHLVKNHPFVDGNKRTGLMAMLAFLGLNGLRIEASEDELANLVLAVARGRISKAEIAVFAKDHARPRSSGARPRDRSGTARFFALDSTSPRSASLGRGLPRGQRRRVPRRSGRGPNLGYDDDGRLLAAWLGR